MWRGRRPPHLAPATRASREPIVSALLQLSPAQAQKSKAVAIFRVLSEISGSMSGRGYLSRLLAVFVVGAGFPPGCAPAAPPVTVPAAAALLPASRYAVAPHGMVVS